MALLDDEDVAYLRDTQTEVQPTAAIVLRRKAPAGDGMGGRTTEWPETGTATTVRLTNVVDKSEGGDVPVAIAAKYQATDLVRVHGDAHQPPLTIGDRLVIGALTYDVVSDSKTRAWGTTHTCWAVQV